MTPDFGAKRERFVVDLVHLQADKVRGRDGHASFPAVPASLDASCCFLVNQ
jgi:hypothetical protein